MKRIRQAEVRLKYLESAASILQLSSPPISARLQLESNDLTNDGDTPTAQEDGRSCPACGTTFVPGWSCKTIIKVAGKRTRKDRVEKGSGDVKTIRVQCLKCDAVTPVESLKSAKNAAKSNSLEKCKSVFPGVQPMRDPPKPAESDSDEQAGPPSRKRARGKKSTLRSMLSVQQNSTTSAQPGFGLDLKDFMKT